MISGEEAADLPSQMAKVSKEAGGAKFIGLNMSADGRGYAAMESGNKDSTKNYDLKNGKLLGDTSAPDKPYLPVAVDSVNLSSAKDWTSSAPCGGEAQVFARTTATGKLFVETTCGDDITYQSLDGQPVKELPALYDAASIETALAEARGAVGESLLEFAIRGTMFTVTGAAREIQDAPCTPSYSRWKAIKSTRGEERGLHWPGASCTARGQASTPYNAAEIKPAQLMTAIKAGMQVMKVGSTSELAAVEVHKGAKGLEVRMVGDKGGQLVVVDMTGKVLGTR